MANIQKELLKFFKSEEGEEIIGQIMLNAINMSMVREIVIEDGKSDVGRVVEKTIKVNALDQIIKYLPYLEGAIRGCQSDSAQARNRATEVKNALNNVLHLTGRARGTKELL